MSQALNEIQELFSNSEIDPVELNDLLVFLPILPEDVLQKLSEAFQAEPALMKEFVDNFRAKFNALAGKQDKVWEDIDEDEIGKADEFNENDQNLDNFNRDDEDF
jgi:hypothetical protein